MIRSGYLDSESRKDLTELARDGSVPHRLARRANALVLLDDGMSCEAVASVLLLDDDTVYWLRVSGVAGLDERGRSSEDPGVPPRCDDFVILWVGGRNFVIPEPCGVTAPSALSQFGTQRPADASRDGVG